MNPADPETSGTGGGLRYLTEEAAPEMVNQEQPHSCQAACARQLLKDAGVDVSEADLLAKIGYYEGYGTLAESTAVALSDLHPTLVYQGGCVPPEQRMLPFTRDPWIANLGTDRGTIHAVIVDRLEEGIVHVRDPWGTEMGSVATILLADFLDHWARAFNKAVIPIQAKKGT